MIVKVDDSKPLPSEDTDWEIVGPEKFRDFRKTVSWARDRLPVVVQVKTCNVGGFQRISLTKVFSHFFLAKQ